MLENLKKNLGQMTAQKLLKNYGLELKHFTPGRVRLAMPSWQTREADIRRLLQEMKADPDVTGVEFTEVSGSILIQYKPEAPKNPATVARWRRILEKYM